MKNSITEIKNVKKKSTRVTYIHTKKYMQIENLLSALFINYSLVVMVLAVRFISTS